MVYYIKRTVGLHVQYVVFTAYATWPCDRLWPWKLLHLILKLYAVCSFQPVYFANILDSTVFISEVWDYGSFKQLKITFKVTQSYCYWSIGTDRLFTNDFLWIIHCRGLQCTALNHWHLLWNVWYESKDNSIHSTRKWSDHWMRQLWLI